MPKAVNIVRCFTDMAF